MPLQSLPRTYFIVLGRGRMQGKLHRTFVSHKKIKLNLLLGRETFQPAANKCKILTQL
jgi:hypothetical protein